MAEQDAQQFDPSQHTVAEVGEYLATADTAEQERVYQAERDGQARKGILGGADDAPAEDQAPGDVATSTEGATFDAAAAQATPAERGYIGTSPEAERTGRSDKGLSQANPAVMSGGPIPDARPGVDDSDALKG